MVDDELGVRQLICQMLEREGYTTLEAGDGHEALTLLTARAGDVALVLSDVRMPVMNGIQLEQAVHDDWPELPVILMSGEATREWLVRLAQETPPIILRKPFHCDELVDLVRRQVRRRSDPGAEPGGQPRIG